MCLLRDVFFIEATFFSLVATKRSRTTDYSSPFLLSFGFVRQIFVFYNWISQSIKNTIALDGHPGNIILLPNVEGASKIHRIY